MFVELHILQNFAPSNLNRDDNNAPKSCDFGGYRRARISSQCLKRAIRTTFAAEKLIPEPQLASRTKRLVDELVKRLVEGGKDAAEAQTVVSTALAGIKLGVKDDGKTEYLLFLGAAEIEGLAAVCLTHWDVLKAATEPAKPGDGAAKKSAKDTKRAGKEAIPAEVGNALLKVLNGGKAADLALFGRMLADLPDHNVDAACQVAHALSTNRVATEFDFYTAVDDLKPEDSSGADMLGTVEFNSACFYRYANVDVETLLKNLGGDVDLARQTLQAFIESSILAVPTGKQNSMAAQNPPSFVLAVVRERGLWSLANAFVKPISPGPDGDLVRNSVKALDDYWGKLTVMYGDKYKVGSAVSLDGVPLNQLQNQTVENIDALVIRTLEAAFSGEPAQ